MNMDDFLMNKLVTIPTTQTTKYAEKLVKIEKELLKLKKGSGYPTSQIFISLKGILKGVKVAEQDIAQAKKSLFKNKF